MPTTMNDVTQPAATGNGSSGSGGRTDAVGAEIPVIVHASRYSAASRGVGKNLPPVHEETRTVIVFSNGAVVRLSAALTTGELVVLTNQQTGADVICRVANVKAQPGIQNYVNLEFTQRAPGFWGDAIQADRADRSDRQELPVSPKPVETPIESAPRAPISVPAAELISAVQAVTELLNTVPTAGPASLLASIPAVQLPAQTPAAASLQELHSAIQSAKELGSQMPVAAPPKQPQEATAHISIEPPLELSVVDARTAGAGAGLSIAGPKSSAPEIFSPKRAFTPPDLSENPADARKPAELHFQGNESPSGSKKVLLIVAAAVVLLIVGGIGGAALFRQNRPTVVQQVSNMPEAAPPAVSATTTPMPTSMATVQPAVEGRAETSRTLLSAVATSPITATLSAGADARTLNSDSKSPIAEQPDKQSERNSSILISRISAPIAKTAAGVTSSEPPPVVTTETNDLADNNLLAGAGRVPVVPTSEPNVAGAVAQIQQLRPVSSPAAIYPTLARSQGIQGTVVIDALVDVTGKVSTLKIVSGPLLLQQAAIDAVRTWTYVPARVNGQPTATHTQVNINFRMADNDSASGASGGGAHIAPASPPNAVTPTMAAQNQQPKLVSSSAAIYPPLARAEHIQGMVMIDALVDVTGKISSLKVVSGPSILQQAALDAVRTWRYQPARLNGQPIAAHTQVSVNFSLQ